MKKVSDAVRSIVRSKPFIESALSEGIINFAALANYIHPEVESILSKTVKHGSILMALRRLEHTGETIAAHKLNKVLNNLGDITVRSNLCDYTYKNSDTLGKCQQKLFLQEQDSKDFFLTFSQGVSETTIIMSKSAEANAIKIFKNETVLAKRTKLSSITVKLPEDNATTSGVYFHFFKLFAWEKINITEVISTTNEFTAVVETKDIQKAMGVLMGLKVTS